jgi:hypothetical protein
VPAGRPSSYRKEYAEQSYKLCLLSATDKELADFFGVSEQTLNTWKKAHPEFLESITRGKEIADANVAERLYQRAMGYSHPAVKIFMPAGALEPVYAPYTEHYPPDTPAASLWLRNRQSGKWREKQEHDHTVRRDARELTDDELVSIASTGRDGVVGEATGKGKPGTVH